MDEELNHGILRAIKNQTPTMSKTCQTGSKSEERLKGVGDAIRRAVDELNRNGTEELAVLFLTGEEEKAARALIADKADREQLSEDIRRLDEALRMARSTLSHSQVEAELQR
ncbi:MAG: hypothetical protein QOH96_2699 [Blastocatellia bacterium]|nr:hypothetical protein [Blastocatellia bacterium]